MPRKHLLPFAPPAIDDSEVEEVTSALRDGWLTRGPRTERFERDFAARVGAEAAIAVSSGTAALQVALASLGVGPGAEVIVPTMTYCAAANVIELLGATPVLVDVEPETLNIDAALVARRLSKSTRAILPVHLHGHPAEMEPLLELSAAHGVPLVEDAAHALPARYKGRQVGSIATLTAFSFYATKNLTTGEGGMLTGTARAVQRARPWSAQGISRDSFERHGSAQSWRYDVVVPGFKANMSDVQAAIGLRQLLKLDGLQARRRQLAAAYDAALQGMAGIETPRRKAHVETSHHLYVIRLDPDQLHISRDAFIDELYRRNIATSVHFIPLHLHSYYRAKYGFAPGDFPVASREYERIVSLPLHPLMSDDDLQDVVEAVAVVTQAFRR